jgi:hypothetical protein
MFILCQEVLAAIHKIALVLAVTSLLKEPNSLIIALVMKN